MSVNSKMGIRMVMAHVHGQIKTPTREISSRDTSLVKVLSFAMSRDGSIKALGSSQK